MKHYPEFKPNGKPQPKVVSEVVSALQLPQDYASFLEESNGGSGFIGEEYVIFTKVEELVTTNVGHRVDEFFPGILLIGSNGGSEALAIDQRANKAQYILIPFMFEDAAIVRLGDTFEEMIEKIEYKGFFGE